MTELETYNHILATASQLIAERGFAKTSMNEIIKASGLSKGGVYWHFKSKDEIIFAVVETIFKQQMTVLEAVLSGEGKAVDRLTQLLDLVSQSISETQQSIPSPIDVYAHVLKNKDLTAHLKSYFEQYQQMLMQLIVQGIEEGDFTSEHPDQVALVFISTIEGILLIHDILGEQHSLADTIKQASELFLTGLMTKGHNS